MESSQSRGKTESSTSPNPRAGGKRRAAAAAVAGGATAFVVAGPIVAVGVVGIVACRWASKSANCAFDQALDTLLRERSKAGDCVSLIRKFSKGIDRICSSNDGPGKSDQNIENGHRNSWELPGALCSVRHDGIVLRLGPEHSVPKPGPDLSATWPGALSGALSAQTTWIKIEFVKKGLKFEHSDVEPIIDKSTHRDCRLKGVSPIVFAQLLDDNKDKTYDGIRWNCNHVADMLWDAAATQSSETGIAACVVCTDQPPSVVFVPCGHASTCDACASRTVICPICNALIEHRTPLQPCNFPVTGSSTPLRTSSGSGWTRTMKKTKKTDYISLSSLSLSPVTGSLSLPSSTPLRTSSSSGWTRSVTR